MGDEEDNFYRSGPLHLTNIDWKNAHHRRSVAACLVEGCYIQQKENREGISKALAPPWWESFNFILDQQLIDKDNSIFGAVYRYKPPKNSPNDNSPRYVIAFRGTLTKRHTILRDFQLNLHVILNLLHKRSRSKIAIETVQNIVTKYGETNVWLAGHSLGASMAMLVGKDMAKSKTFLECFLFNPPIILASAQRFEDTKRGAVVQLGRSLLTAGFSLLIKGRQNREEDPFDALSPWVPNIFVNPQDFICRGYLDYFESWKRMKEWKAEKIERLATKNSFVGLFMHVIGMESEPLHSIPSANLTVNLSPAPDFKQAHELHQWWKPDMHFQSNIHNY